MLNSNIEMRYRATVLRYTVTGYKVLPVIVGLRNGGKDYRFPLYYPGQGKGRPSYTKPLL